MIRRDILGLLAFVPLAAMFRPGAAAAIPPVSTFPRSDKCICTSPTIRALREMDDRRGRRANRKTNHAVIPVIVGDLTKHPLNPSIDGKEMAVFPVGHGWIDVRAVYRDFRPPGPVGYFQMASPDEYEVIHTVCSSSHPVTLLHFRRAKTGERQSQLSFDETCHTIFVDLKAWA